MKPGPYRRLLWLFACWTAAGAAQTEATPAVPDAAQAVQAGEIVVTGSRIEQAPESVSSSPVTSVGADFVSSSGRVERVDLLKELPALTGSLGRDDAAGRDTFAGFTGLSLLNLRNLGVDRTLVLVDGRRHVASAPGSAAVDIETIPLALIERIEVQTGGTSAIYGADGVSGVVNFIMRRDFEGLDLRAQGGSSDQGGGGTRLLSAVGGRSFDQDRGNISIALEYSRSNRLRSDQRDFTRSDGRFIFLDNPADRADDPAVPDRVPLNDIRFFDGSRAGAVDVDFDFFRDFNGDDTPFDSGLIASPDPFSPPIAPFYQQGGDGTPEADTLGDLLPENQRYTINSFLTYALTPKVHAFGDFKYSRGEAFAASQPTTDFFLNIEPDYAFTPPNIAAAAAQAAASGASDGQILVTRDHFDLGVRTEDITRETLRSVIGLSAELSERVRYEISYVYGQTEVDNEVGNTRFNDRFAAALDAVIDPATGQPTCRSKLDPEAVPFNIELQTNILRSTGWNPFEPLPGTWAGSFRPGADSGCVPANIFGDGAISAAAASWINGTARSQAKLKQQVAQAYLSGTTEDWFALPAGAPGFAGGVEYRKEEADSDPAIEERLGLSFGNVLQPSRGDYDVTEVFAEVNLPLLAGRPFVETLSLDAAVRRSDYSTIGAATTWKTGLVWAPLRDLSFRGTVAQATRAPNIGELFAPNDQVFGFISDPCDVNNLDQGTPFRAANCAELLTALGVDPVGFTDPNSSLISGSRRGNRELEEEEADTSTIGVVIRPRSAPGLSLSLDWYRIELDNAIYEAPAQEAGNTCVDLPSLDNPFCRLQTREEGSGAITDFSQQPLNVAEFTTEGYDLDLSYVLDPARYGATGPWGTFKLRMIANKLEELSFINLPGATPDSDEGEGPNAFGFGEAPDWQVNFDLSWIRGPLFLNYGFTWFDETQRFVPQTIRNNPDAAEPRFFDYSAYFTQDVQARYEIVAGLSIYAGVNNFTDEKPDIGETAYPVGALGRFFYAGLLYQ